MNGPFSALAMVPPRKASEKEVGNHTGQQENAENEQGCSRRAVLMSRCCQSNSQSSEADDRRDVREKNPQLIPLCRLLDRLNTTGLPERGRTYRDRVAACRAMRRLVRNR